MDKNEVSAVHEEDLEGTLRKIGLLDELNTGKIKCKFCSTQITLSNMHSILPHSQGFSFICDKPECTKKLMEYLEENNSTKQG